MNCPLCGAWSNVLDTRAGPHGSLKRRRECANEHRFITLEVRPAAVSMRDLAKRPQQNKTWLRDQAIRNDPRPNTHVAAEYGITEARVRQIRLGGSQTTTRKRIHEEEHRGAPVRQRVDGVRNAAGK